MLACIGISLGLFVVVMVGVGLVVSNIVLNVTVLKVMRFVGN
jgi:hypothetical protein